MGGLFQRRPQRIHRALVAVLGIVGIVTATVVTTRDTETGAASTTATPPPGPLVAVAMTSQPGESVGPTEDRDGVPLGWRNSIAGAEAAATAYVAVTGRVSRSGPLQRRDMLLSMASASYGPSLVDRVGVQLNDLLYRMGDKGWSTSGMVWVEYPLSVRSESNGEGRVRVGIWSVTVFALPGGSVSRQVWRSSTLDLVWERQDWKVDRWEAKEGPVPAPAPEARLADSAGIAEVARWRPTTGVGGDR
jgi:hypothetical protein